MQFKIVTDSSCNLNDEMIREFGLHILPLTFMSDGEQYQSYTEGADSDLASFFKMMREGKVFTTSLPNIQQSMTLFKQLLDDGNDVLYIGFSSGLSGTYQSTAAALDELRSQYPNRKIYHTDTLAAAMGEGLIVYRACMMAREGASIEDVHAWIEDNKLSVAHWFTVDDLMFLFRGGRVSRTSAWAGTLLNIKPVLHVDEEGKLVPMEKVRGRKKSLQALADHLGKSGVKPLEDQEIFISHGDCAEDANYLVDLIKERYGCTKFFVNTLDPVIGAHAGPGTVALFFMAEQGGR